VSDEEFHYEELTPDQVVALHQERWAQHLDRWSQSVGNNDKQRFKITKQRIQVRQIIFGMCYRREYLEQMC
jgi:hypothetical protein